tara:strand:- start:94 stop:282 length:189 start_codon:yes stop_codon:yes gene_type:complete
MNPVGKVREIVDLMTDNSFVANQIMSVITRQLNVKEIDKFYEELKKNSNQLKLNFYENNEKK